jgi:hypothetical protein
MTTAQPSWKAEFEGSTLHISGVAKYPNDFSTASLERVDSDAGSDVVSYRVVFHRDKEPFCDLDLIGPVHYYEQHLPNGAARIRVTVGTEQIEFPIPYRANRALIGGALGIIAVVLLWAALRQR